MRAIVTAHLDKTRPALVLTAERKIHLVDWFTIAPIIATIRDLTTEVPVGVRNGLDQASVVSCDNITTVPADSIGNTIGVFFPDQEPELARAIGDAFDLFPL